MQSILLIIGVGLAAAAVPLYKPQECHTYRYEAQLVTGSAASSRLWSGLRLAADLHVCFNSDSKFTAKLSRVSLHKLDQVVEERGPAFFMQPPETLLDGVEVEVTEVMVTQLQQPFYVSWKKGFVADVKFGSSDPLWSTNIKRGVIGLFQVNLDQTYSVDPLVSRGPQYNPIRPSYTVWEPTTFGYCRTTYTPKPSEVTGSFYLTKVRDYSSCLKTNPTSYVFDNVRSHGDKNTNEHLSYRSEVTYSIQGDVKGFVILTAVGESKITFVPYGLQDGSVQTSINQTLYLTSAGISAGSSPLRMDPSQTYVSTSLEMVPPARDFQDREPYQEKSSPWPAPTGALWDISKIDQLLTWVANGTDTHPSQEVLLTMHLLIEMIRYSRRDVLDELLKRVVSETTGPSNCAYAPLKFQIYWDLLSSAATTPAFSTLLNACLNRNTYGGVYAKCFSAVTSAGTYAPPSEKTVSLLLLLLKQNRKDRKLRNVVALALGSLMGRAEDIYLDLQENGNKHLNAMKKIVELGTANDRQSDLRLSQKRLRDRLSLTASKHSAIETKFRKAINDVFLQTNLDFDLIVAMKTFRNAHVLSTLTSITTYLTNRLLPSTVRLAAAQALEKFTDSSARTEIGQVLEQVIKDPGNPTAVRIQCFRTLVNIRGPPEILFRLAASMRYEDEKQMATYVWTVLDKLRNSTFRPYADVAQKLQSVINFLRPIDAGVQDSRYSQYHKALANNLGVVQELSYIATTDGNHTLSLDTSHIVDIFGTANQVFSTSFQSTGAGRLLKTLMGGGGFFTNRNSLFDLLQRPKRATGTESLIRDIFLSVGVNTALRDLHDTKGYLHLQFLNNAVRSWDFSDLLKDLVDLNKIVMSFDEDALRAGHKVDYKRAGKMLQYFLDLPSEAGFPVKLQMGATYSLKVGGVVSAGVELSAFKDVRGSNPPSKVWGRVDLDPRIVASLSGKMSVDGYLLHAGSAFQAVATLKTPFSWTAAFQPPKSRFRASIVPPVDESQPILTLEAKPYSYCLAVSNNVSKPQEPVNRRPYFITTQTLYISNGARVHNFQYKVGKSSLGYDVTWQGQYPRRSLPSTPAAPMLGLFHAALYIRSGELTPPKLSVDFKYLTKPRYTDPESGNGACDSWWSWLGWKCYGTGEQDDVTNVHNVNPTYTAPYGDLPDLSSDDVTFDAVKARMERLAGHEIPLLPSNSQWAFIVILNASSPALHRAYSLEGLTQAWRLGKLHDGFYNAYRTPVPAYDEKPWNMLVKTYTTFPERLNKVEDLLSTKYISQTYSDMLDRMKTREHKVINRNFQSLLYSELSRLAMWKLPSLEPQMMLDKVMPENIYRCQNSVCYGQLKNIIKNLLPLAEELQELKSEMRDAFKISVSEGLLLEKARQLSYVQNMTSRLIALMPQTVPRLDPELLAATQYVVLKISQSLLDLRDILNRGSKLGLLNVNSNLLDVNQQTIFGLSASLLAWKTAEPDSVPAQIDENSDTSRPFRHGAYSNYDSAYGYGSDDSKEDTSPDSAESEMDVGQLIFGLQTLSNRQLKVISESWNAIVDGSPLEIQDLRRLIGQATANLTGLGSVLTDSLISLAPSLGQLVYQTTLQHQTLVLLLEAERGKPLTSGSDRRLVAGPVVSAKDRYALKVQTKRMLEMALVIQRQDKSNKTCLVLLTGPEKQTLRDLFVMERRLVASVMSHARLPDPTTPWTSDSSDIALVVVKMAIPMLGSLRTMRDRMLKASSAPHPCVMTKLVETTLTFQQKLAMLMRALPAQFAYDETLIDQVHEVCEQAQDFLVSLDDVFDAYVYGKADGKPLFFDEGSNSITQGWMEVKTLRYEQGQVLEKLATYLQGSATPPFDTVRHVLQTAYDTTVELKEKLKRAGESVKSSRQAGSPVTFLSVYSLFYDSLETQFQIYRTLEQQLRLYDQRPGLPDLGEQVKNDKVEIAKLAKESNGWTQGSGALSRPEDDEAYSYGWSQPYDDKGTLGKEQASDSAPTPQDVEKLQPKISLASSHCSRAICFVANVTYGGSDVGKKRVTVKILGGKSVQQKLWEVQQHDPETRDPCVARAIRASLTGRDKLEMCSHFVHDQLNTFTHLHLHASGDQLWTPLLKSYCPWLGYNVLDRLLTSLEVTHWDRSSVWPAVLTSDENTVQAILDVHPSLSSANHYYLTPHKTLQLDSVPVMPWLQAWYPFQNIVPLSKLALLKQSSGHLPGMCKVQGSSLKTTDGGVLSLPWELRSLGTEGCRVLLVSDCSSDATFAINLLPNASLAAHGLEILAEQHHVILQPYYVSDAVSVDSSMVDLRYGKPLVYYKSIAYGREAVAMVVSRNELGHVRTEFPSLGLDVVMDYKYINIETSGVYKSQLCGLCGNFDGQVTKELLGPNGHSYSNADKFFRSYLIPDKSCSLFQGSGGRSEDADQAHPPLLFKAKR